MGRVKVPVHPIIQRALRRAYHRGHHELPRRSLAEIRQYYEETELPRLASPDYAEYQVLGATLRLHCPIKTAKPLPVVIYFRASAYIFGNIDDTDYFAHHLAKYLKCIVAVIEPRRAPEYKFPIPFNDCIAGIHYLIEHHAKLQINPNKMAVWGESSGGNFAAAVCHYLKAEKVNNIGLQVLFYPMLDYYQHHLYPSKQDFGEGFLMDKALADWFVAQYITDPMQCQDPRISPLLAENFEKLPQTLVIGAQYDPMRDESCAYVEKLVKAKVPAKAFFLPGMIHGFLLYTSKLEAPRFAQRYAANFLKDGFLGL
ncbi:MAG: hypothetical protein BGO43_02575 [Gammaproteobacteria bacterium 39-13]|nr:MAG: hypothetical protein BGO43_02575 [Gammaproteobacteria bacterium 39-13]